MVKWQLVNYSIKKAFKNIRLLKTLKRMNIYSRPSAKAAAHKAIDEALSENPVYSIISVEMFIEIVRSVHSKFTRN